MPDAGGNIKGIALGGKAGDVLERIQRREFMRKRREDRAANPEKYRGYQLAACSCGCGNFPHLCPNYQAARCTCDHTAEEREAASTPWHRFGCPALGHLNDDAPYMMCDTCGRHSYNPDVRPGTSCGMPQPTGGPCEGHFIESERIT